MKNILLTAALMLVALGSNAQGLTPSPSPKGRVASAGRLTIEPRVGMTIATFTGSGAGGATDSVPIEVSPGIGGMQPLVIIIR